MIVFLPRTIFALADWSARLFCTPGGLRDVLVEGDFSPPSLRSANRFPFHVFLEKKTSSVMENQLILPPPLVAGALASYFDSAWKVKRTWCLSLASSRLAQRDTVLPLL